MIRSFVVVKHGGRGRAPKHLIRHMVDHIDEPMRVHKYSVMPVTSEHEMRDWAGTLRVPTLLIDRDDDPLAPVAEIEELAAMLPGLPRRDTSCPTAGASSRTPGPTAWRRCCGRSSRSRTAQERPMDDAPGLV